MKLALPTLPTPVPHAVVPLQVTSGLNLTGQMPSDCTEGGVYPYTGHGGWEESEIAKQ